MSLTNQLLTPTNRQSCFTPLTVKDIPDEDQPSATALLKLISNGSTTIELKNHFVLARSNQIQCQFFQGADQMWYCQYGEHQFQLRSGMVLALDNQIWQFEQQHRQPPKATTSLHFQISCDEEHVRLSINHHNETNELGERVHHYPLLLLARQYREDQRSGFDHTSCGWLDTASLSKMIGIEASVLNVQLHRAKQQLSTIVATSDLIERRTGQIRLNCPNVEIIRGTSIEY